MKNFLPILFVLLTLSGFAQTKSINWSPPLIEGSPESVGVSEERINRIDDMCQQAIMSDQVPGIVALIARKGKIVFHKAYGASNDSGQMLKRDDIFRIASQTKAVTATAVMMLWEEGRFQLDDPISKYIPEFKDSKILDTLYADGTYETIPTNKEISIRHLLSHTSGIGYGVIDADKRFRKIYKNAGITDLFTTENISIGESIKKLAALPLHHNPGEKFTYSEGLDVLGYFIEIISGQALDEFFRKRIFDPLGMDDTWFYLPESKHSRLVTIQRKTQDKWSNFPKTFYDPDYPITGSKRFFSGGAGLSSTAKDYATFLQMYLNNGELEGIRILSRTTVQSILANHINNLWGESGSYYGLAFGVIDENGQDMGGRGSSGTFEWGGYFNTQYFADPKEQIIGMIFKQTQGATEDETGWKFRQLVGQIVDD